MHTTKLAAVARDLPIPAAAPVLDLKLMTASQLDPTNLMSSLRTAVIAQALARGEPSFKVFKEFSLSARMDAHALLDHLAHSSLGFGHRINSHTLMILDLGLFVTIEAFRKSDYCACAIRIWAATSEQAAAAEASLCADVGDRRISDPWTFAVDWRFVDGLGLTRGVRIEEMAAEVLLEEAYPCFPGGVADFIDRYLAAPESILVLQGPPGTGKTRFIRNLLGVLSQRKKSLGLAMYTSDERVLQRDEMFMEFLTGPHDVLVVEDADLLLTARSSGNRVMHRFLNIADGIIGAQHRKIIFSTNLRNIRDIDEALVRPGRCFAHVGMRELTPAEARRVLERLCEADLKRLEAALGELGQERSYSVAVVYAAYRGSAAGLHNNALA